ncbi:Proton-dependent oligopeptide transporter family [Dillenia turbinata]|uniref:Proton-dependent oligopeptide transporter family n=1 Tax=Dillenia turbinata TaxID=194707 RepID=A0AAN8ULL4_9MAGN
MQEREIVEGKVDWRGRPAKKDKHGGMNTSVLVLAVLAFESLAFFGTSVNLVTYFSGVMHYDVADAANQLSNFMGTSYILTIVMATLADTCIGRFRSIVIWAFVEFLGYGLLALQAHEADLHPPLCNIFDPREHCEKVSGGQAAMLFVSLYMVACGTAGVKTAVPSHGADQFDPSDPSEAKQLPTFFNWVLLSICIGGSLSLTFVVWIQDNKGWAWGFGIPTFAVLFGLLVFLAGICRYRIYVVKGSSAVTEIMQVFVAALQNRNLDLPEDAAELYEIDRDKEAALVIDFLPHTNDLRFLDKAAIRTTSTTTERQNPWKLCTVTQVENVKVLLGILPIFCCTIIMTLCLAQLQTFSVQQGTTMDTRLSNSFHMPPASLPIFPVAFLLIMIPTYDRICVPFLRKITGIPTGITHLQRIGAGLILSSLSMAIAALVEVKRKHVAREHNMLDAIPILQPLPIRVFWLAIQYFIFGIADMFTFVGLLEFFYSELPRSIKSISTCFLWSSMSLGYYLSTIMVKIVNAATKDTRSGGWLAGNNINRNHLNLFYWLLSIISLLNFFVYLFFAKRYKYRRQNPAA